VALDLLSSERSIKYQEFLMVDFVSISQLHKGLSDKRSLLVHGT
jgi:hypothetical protein